ncbi:DUF6121 family protein [Naasia sp. SYSU D00948]|uniref:DUF6121 family protein n=1 Tax=Naasia sp. SYSU D00948 TaxID=2817379 RepID=UPI001B300528|nr:DUF6121 family protein [Naasia sp. SYSU D00948]
MTASSGAPSARLGLLAVLTTAAWIAVVIAVWGVLSLLLDTDVIRQQDAGPYLGPSMVAVAAVALALLVLRIVRTDERPPVAFFGTAAAVFLVLLFVGGIGYTLVRGELFWLLGFPLEYAPSPFIVAAALLAGAAALIARVIGRAEKGGARRPRWPWEDPSDA